MIVNHLYNYSPIVHTGVWGNSISKLDIKSLVKSSYLIKAKTPTVNKSNKGPGWQSPDDIFLNPNFKNLADFINLEGQKFTKDSKISLHSMWVNISPPGSFNSLHNHAHNTNQKNLSGVLYLKTPPNCGGIVFMDPLNFNGKFTFSVNEGTIYFFDSRLYHSVEPNLSNEDRISIAFNFLKNE